MLQALALSGLVSLVDLLKRTSMFRYSSSSSLLPVNLIRCFVVGVLVVENFTSLHQPLYHYSINEKMGEEGTHRTRDHTAPQKAQLQNDTDLLWMLWGETERKREREGGHCLRI